MINLNKLSELMLQIAEERQKNGATVNTDTMKMLKHCAHEDENSVGETYKPAQKAKAAKKTIAEEAQLGFDF